MNKTTTEKDQRKVHALLGEWSLEALEDLKEYLEMVIDARQRDDGPV